MKQHITIKQAQELNSKQLEDIGVLRRSKAFFSWEKVSEVLTIGRMIDILTKKHKPIIETDWFENPDEFWWIVTLDRREHFYFSEKELVNALWKAVKYVLEADYEKE